MTDRTDRPDLPGSAGSAGSAGFSGPPEAPESPQAAQVRRLLADARHDEPMPAEVVSRLDEVLASLGDETPGALASSGAPVLAIPARRRRNVAGLLLAAAAVVVGGVVVAPHVHLTPQHGSASTASGGGAEAGFDSQAAGGSSKNRPHARSLQGRRLVAGRLVVRPRHFAQDARQGLTLLDGSGTPTRSAPRCAGIPTHRRSVAAEYLHAPAALVYGPDEGSSRVVDLYVCGSSRPVRSTTLATR